MKVLVSAYMSDTIVHGSVHAGAAGCIMNLNELKAIRERLGNRKYASTLIKSGSDVSKLVGKKFKTQWYDDMLASRNGMNTQYKQRYNGYYPSELNLIERAFNSYNKKTDPDCFLGISAVFTVLCKIHMIELSDM